MGKENAGQKGRNLSISYPFICSANSLMVGADAVISLYRYTQVFPYLRWLR